ncbi:MAG: N-acetylmuramoyl-L-alanine amidase [Muribaculaceae bacterium]|nr:N-acetylmuramoyl-L-alanine amidase [Muribaculaceae bacterium]
MTTIKKGSRGADVKTLQTKLGITADGIFGNATETAVKAFQTAHGLVADGIVGAKTWAALGVRASAGGRKITEIIVHCEATPEGEDFTPEQVNICHKQRRFSPYVRDGKTWYIGYHYVIQLDGRIIPCRPESVKGCHCSGHNANSIGISYVGGCPPRTDPKWMNKAKDTRTPAQKASLIKLLKELKSRYPNAKIYGHRDFAPKGCPSFDARNEYKNL